VAAASEDAEVAAAMLTLRTHSKDGVCPLCGHPHTSQDDLQREIDARLVGISATASCFQREGQELDQQKTSVRGKLATVDDELAQLRRQRDNAGRQIELLLQTSRELEEKALRVGAPLERAALERTLASQRDAAVTIKTELGLAQAGAKSTQQQLLEARAGSAALSERLAADRSSLDQLLIQKAEIDRQINLCEPVTGGVDAAIEAAQERLVAKRAEYEAKVAATATMQRDLSAERERGSELGNSVGAAERTLIEVTNAISSLTARLRSLKLSEDTSSDQLREIQAAAQANERKALEFSDSLERFKAQQKREVLERERDELRRQEAELAATKRRLQHSRSQIEAASAEAAIWEAKLGQRVKDSVSHRLNQHRIESFRLFQSMIPAPYLFEDITVTQDEDGVRLGLRYRDVSREVGEPRYFLSSAQANVLALSYFLSFASRQRWCKLRTVLMDDPVQHLDDLDAVAFLDIVRALVISSAKPRRQMIISTCDYNLYALMIRKFSCLPPDQLRFAALSLHDISADGPVVRYDYGETTDVRAA